MRLLFLILMLVGCKSHENNEPTQIANLDTQKTYTKIAFSSCDDPKNPAPIWKVIQNQNPDLYIGVGDNVYASKPEHGPFAQVYKEMANDPDFKPFRAKVPIIATWDDHDYGANDGGKENPKKEEAKKYFLEFFPNDAKVIHDRGGVEHSFMLGPKGKQIHVIFMDTRYNRDPLVIQDKPINELDKFKATTDKSTTILGPIQWKWLEEEFKKPAALRLLVSSIQLVADQHGFEKWANFPHEKKHLYSLLNKSKVKTIVLSGDRHAGEISVDGKVVDVTASGINRNSTIKNEKNRFRVGPQELNSNFGLLSIDWAKKIAKVELIDGNNKPFSNYEVKF